jgi:hypothetical protein
MINAQVAYAPRTVPEIALYSSRRNRKLIYFGQLAIDQTTGTQTLSDCGRIW